MARHVKQGASWMLTTPKRLIEKHHLDPADQEYLTYVDDQHRIIHVPQDPPELLEEQPTTTLSKYAEQVIVIMEGRTQKSLTNVWRAFQKTKGKKGGQLLLDNAILELTQAGLFYRSGADLMRGKLL